MIDKMAASYYSAAEAAEKLGVHRESLLRALRRGTTKLTVHTAASWRTHRKYFFVASEVDALAESRNRPQPR